MIITLSRQIATHGELVGQLVAARLGLRYLDRELLDDLARRLQIDPGVVTQFDESAPDPVQSLLWEWFSHMNEEKYLRALRETLAQIASTGGGIIIGRGANYLLHGRGSLRIRLVAPLEYRLDQFCAMQEMPRAQAQSLIRQNDRIRERFIRKLFRKEMNDPVHYDLYINMADTTIEAATEEILLAAKQRAVPDAPCVQVVPPEPLNVLCRHRPLRRTVVEQTQRKIA